MAANKNQAPTGRANLIMSQLHLLPQPASYFCAHDALAESQLVRVRCNETIPWNQWLPADDAQLQSGMLIERGAIMELPLWMATALGDRISLLPPRQYGNRVRDDLQAGAEAVNFHDLGPHYYRLGLKLGVRLPSLGIASLLQGALQARLRKISQPLLSPSVSTGALIETGRAIYQPATGPTAKMDMLEQDLHELAKRTRRGVDAWWQRETLKIKKYASE